MDPNWIELFTVSHHTQSTASALAHALRECSLLQASQCCCGRPREGQGDVTRLTWVSGGPPLEHAKVVPSEPKARKQSRDSESQRRKETPLYFDRLPDTD